MRTLLEMLAIAPGERVLDVATGSAGLLVELARTSEPPAQAIGVDNSPEMLALAPALNPGWELRLADATDLPFGDESFDVLTASYLLHVVEPEQRARLISEMKRVLRPGGRIGVITVAPPRGRLAKVLLGPLVSALERSPGRLAALRPLDPVAELRQAGFAEPVRRRVLRGYPSLCVVAGSDRHGGEVLEALNRC